MMEAVKFLCEFFFGSFWHWAGLVVITAIVFRMPLLSINAKNKEGK